MILPGDEVRGQLRRIDQIIDLFVGACIGPRFEEIVVNAIDVQERDQGCGRISFRRTKCAPLVWVSLVVIPLNEPRSSDWSMGNPNYPSEIIRMLAIMPFVRFINADRAACWLLSFFGKRRFARLWNALISLTQAAKNCGS